MNAFSICMLVPVLAFAAAPLPVDEAPMSPNVVSPKAILEMQETQDPQREEVPPPCPKRKSVIVPGSPVSATSQPTTTCDDGSACGYVLTYNPPATNCAPTTAKLCCVEQMQRAYTQSFSCQPSQQYPNPTVCVGGAKNPFGSTHVVFVTVECVPITGGYKCGEPGEY